LEPGKRKNLFTNYFTSLMDIYDSLFRLGFTLWGEHLAQNTGNARTWQEEIRGFLEAYLSFAIQNPELFQLCFERPVPGFVPSEESLRLSFDLLHSGYARITPLLEQMKSDLTAEQTVDLLIALSHGLTAMHMANEPHLPMGTGRFGSLIDPAISLLEKAWSR
jgi:AcrR family transcriptional regulator